MMTKLSLYAQIGKAELTQALGSSNRKKFTGIEIEVDNETKEVTSTIKTNSSTENSKSKKCLSTTSLLFWLYLHYLSPDQEGLVRDISIKDATEILGFSNKGIRKAIEILSDLGYIYASTIYKNTVTIMLPEFKNYFLKAKDGGHGYIELSYENFLNIVSIAAKRKKRISKDDTTVCQNEKYKNKNIINQIRIKLRAFLICEHAQRMFKKGKKATKKVVKNISDLLEFLPGYFYPKALLETIKCISDVISYTVDDKKITLEAKIEDFNGQYERKKTMCKIRKDLKEKIEKINRAINLYNEQNLSPQFLRDAAGLFVKDDFGYAYESYVITENDLDDLSTLSVNFGKENVIEAVEYIYSNFIIAGRTIKNFGALVRRSIQSYVFKK